MQNNFSSLRPIPCGFHIVAESILPLSCKNRLVFNYSIIVRYINFGKYYQFIKYM